MPTGIYFAPSGPRNLATMFPDIDFNAVAEYNIEVLAGGTIATSPMFKLISCDDYRVVHFVNYNGGIDQIGFEVSMEHEVKSTLFEAGTPTPYNHSAHGQTRLTVRGNDVYTGVAALQENYGPLIKQLLDAPLQWMQYRSTYIPILIEDQKVELLKKEDRFIYEFQLTWRLSHETIVIAN